MFKDFYESMWKKTTPQEKKEVVKNAGTYFPANHSNKIKGIDELAEAVVNNAMKKQDDIVKNKRTTAAAYTTKNCETCGKEFQCYRNRGRWCKECSKERQLTQHREYSERKKLKSMITPRISKNAKTRAKQRGTSYEYELTKILKGYDPLRKPNKNAKINAMEEKKTMEYHKPLDTAVEDAVNNATKRERSCANKRAERRNTSYLYELNRILTGVEPIRNGAGRPPKVNVEELTQETQAMQATQEEVEAVNEFDYLGTLELAIEIVRGVKDEEDVKLAVDKVFETLKYHLTK